MDSPSNIRCAVSENNTEYFFPKISDNDYHSFWLHNFIDYNKMRPQMNQSN